MNTAIIGDGTVGTALAKAIGITAIGPGEWKVTSEVVIICVPTITVDGKQDLSAVHQALSRIEGAKLIILRSTVLPGTTEELQRSSRVPIMFVPEWGFEATMYEDLAHPEYYVIGTTPQSKDLIEMALEILPEAQNFEVVSATAAEFSKYFANIWGSSQVILANSFYDWVMNRTSDPGVYEEAITAAKLHKNIPQWGWKIFDQGSRGYAGKCLPKDTQAAISQYRNPLWMEFERYNKELRGE